MKTTFLLARIILILVTCARLALADGAPELLRLLILDKSGSMAGARIEQLKRTVREWIETYPPSPENPFAILPFDRKAGAVRVFTDKKAIERFLRELEAEGGTSIASGLLAGADFLRNYLDASNLIILLVTDGEDTVDPQAVPAAEARLDAIFAKRDPDRLPTSVFVQRWDNVNDALVSRWLGKPNVKVYDLGSKKPLTLAISPRVELGRVAWSPDTAQRLDAHVTVSIDVQGALPSVEPLDIQVDAIATSAFVVRAEPNVIHREGGPLTLELIPSGEPDKVDVTFQFSVITQEASGGPILATLARPTITVQLLVPPIPIRITSKLEHQGSRWAPSGDIATEASLQLSAVQAAPGLWTNALELVANFGPARVLGGTEVVRLEGQGSVTETYSLEMSPPALGAERSIAVTLFPRTLPWPLQLDPASQLSVTAVVRAPAPLRVPLHAVVKITRDPLWVDLAAGLAAFEAELEITADSVGDGVELVAESPAFEAAGAAPTAVLRNGRASIPVRVEAVMPPNERVPFEIQVSASAGVPPGCTVESGSAHLEVKAPSPASLHLALASPESGSSPALALARTPWSGTVLVTPTISGPAEQGAGKGLLLRVDAPASAAGTELRVGHSTPLALTIPPTPQPALDDQTLAIDLGVVLERDVACVQLERGAISVLLLASHKQKLLVGAVALTLLVVLGLGFRIHAQASPPQVRATGKVT